MSTWRILCCVICFSLVFACFASVSANELERTLDPYEAKCEELKAKAKKLGEKKKAFVIWNAQPNRAFEGYKTYETYACSSSKGKKRKLDNILSSFNNNEAALDDLLKFTLDGKITDLNDPISYSVVKVKSGKKLSSLASKAYNSRVDFEKITESNIDPKTNEIISSGYAFFRTPDVEIEKNCIIGIIPDGFSFKPGPNNKVKKNCILRTIPLHFDLVPLNEILYPTLSVNGASVKEGGILEFEVSKDGKQSLPAFVDYRTVPQSANETNYVPKNGTLKFEKGQSHTIIVRTNKNSKWEENKTIKVELLNPRNVNLDSKSNYAIGTIVNDEKSCLDGTVVPNSTPCPKACWDGSYSMPCPIEPSPPQTGAFSIADATAIEGEPLVFIVSREKPWDRTVTINYKVDDGSAQLGVDYILDIAQPISFELDENEKTISVTTLADGMWSEDKALSIEITSEEDIQMSDAQATGKITNTDRAKKCWDGSEVANLISCPVIIECWDGSEVANETECMPKPTCWNGAEVASLDDCPPCTMKPELTHVSFPIINGEQYIKLEGKACPGHFVSFGANEAFKELQQIKVKQDGTFSFLEKREQFHPVAPYLNIHVASLEYKLADSKPKILSPQMTFGKSRGFIPGTQNCNRVEIAGMPEEHGVVQDAGLRLEEFYVEDRFGECSLNIRGRAGANEDVIIDYSYNPEGNLHTTANAIGDIDVNLTIPELVKTTNELILKVKLRLKNRDGTKTGEAVNFSSWSLQDISQFLTIYYELGEVSDSTSRPSAKPHYNLIKINNTKQSPTEQPVRTPLYYFPPLIDHSKEQLIQNSILNNPALDAKSKEDLLRVFLNLKSQNYSGPTLDQALITIESLKNPEKPHNSILKYNPDDPIKDLKQSPNQSDRPLIFNKGYFSKESENFNKTVNIPSKSILGLKICEIENSNICKDFNVKVPIYFKVEKEPFDLWRLLRIIGSVAATLLAIFQLMEYLLKGTGVIGRFISKFRGNRREIYLAMINAYPQTPDLNNDAVDLWGYTNESGADINDGYSLRKQARRILDFVYDKVGEAEHIKKLIASKPGNPKCQKLTRHLPEAPGAD